MLISHCRLNTDIELGHNCGLRTLHVLTGFHQLKDSQALMKSDKEEDLRQVPHYYLPSLGELSTLIEGIQR